MGKVPVSFNPTHYRSGGAPARPPGGSLLRPEPAREAGVIGLLLCLSDPSLLPVQFHLPQKGGSSNGCHVPEVWLPPPICHGNPTHRQSKPSLQEASLNSTLPQVSLVAAPKFPKRLAASHGKRLVCRRPLRVLQSSPPHPTPGLGPSLCHQDVGFSRLLPAQARAARSTQLHGSRHSRGCSCRAERACCWCRGARGQGHERWTRVWGCPARGGGRAQQPLGVLFCSCCLLVEPLARPLPKGRETSHQVTRVLLPGPVDHTKALFPL